MTRRCALIFAYKQASETTSQNTCATFLSSCHSITNNFVSGFSHCLFSLVVAPVVSIGGHASERAPILNTSISQRLLLRSWISEVYALHQQCKDEGSPSAFLDPPETLLSNLSKMVPPDVLVPGAIQGSSSANGQAGNLTRRLKLCSSASHVSLGHWYHKMVCVCLPCIELQLLHHWGYLHGGNSST